MSDWKRSTREVAVEQLSTEMRQEIQKHIELYNLGNILSDALMCIQTDSEKARKGLFSLGEINQTGAVLTPRWLVWVVSGTQTQVAALSALLQDVVVQDYADTQLAKLVPDSGIQVNGKFTDVIENASAFIGLENNIVGKRFNELVIGAVQDAKK
jgi:hypothetical protein